MGWKNVKEHYRIGHIVQVTEEGICIGSRYISDIIVIGMDGAIKKRAEETVNVHLCRYQMEFDSDPAKLKELIEKTDTFTNSIAVYTYDDGEIIEKQCETPGWPNVTHDGCLMYENTFSTYKQEIVAYAKRNVKAGIELVTDAIEQANQELSIKSVKLGKLNAELAKLESDYPEPKCINHPDK